MRIIALEEHLVTDGLVDATRDLPPDATRLSFPPGSELARRLLDVGEERIAAMDDQGVDVQVLSLSSPGVQSLPPADAAAVARDANDELAARVAEHPDRFAAWAAIPTPDPAAAAAELERAVTELGFVGGLLNGRTGTTNADAARFDDLYATAERLGVPLYLHPQTPVAPVVAAYYSGFGDPLDFVLANAGIGWHYETGMQLLRMILAGVLDRHPDLQLVTGHWGELVLFYLERVQQMLVAMAGGGGLERTLAEYARGNVWLTGSGLLSQRYLGWASEVVGVEHVMSATDYPYVDNSGGAARRFLEQSPLSEAGRNAVASGNWERLTSRRIAGAA